MEAVLSGYELRSIRLLRSWFPMLNHISADKIIATVSTGIAATWAILADVDLAKWSAGIGILAVAIGGGLSSLMSKWSQTKIQIMREQAQAELEIKRQQAEFDKENSGSVLSQMQALTLRFEATNQQLEESRAQNNRLGAAVDAMQRTLEAMEGRVKDANGKLHAMKGQAQQDSLRHTEELQKLKDQHSSEISHVNSQLAAVTASLQSANAELKIANASLGRLSKENENLRRQTANVAASAAKNSQAIEETKAIVDQMAGPNSFGGSAS